MSDTDYDAYAERKREDVLEELWKVLPNHYDGDSHQAIVDNFCKVVDESYPEYHIYINSQLPSILISFTIRIASLISRSHP